MWSRHVRAPPSWVMVTFKFSVWNCRLLAGLRCGTVRVYHMSKLKYTNWFCFSSTGSGGSGAGEGPAASAPGEPVSSPRPSEVWFPPVWTDAYPGAPELPVPSSQFSRPHYNQHYRAERGPSCRHTVHQWRTWKHSSQWRGGTSLTIKRWVSVSSSGLCIYHVTVS